MATNKELEQRIEELETNELRRKYLDESKELFNSKLAGTRLLARAKHYGDSERFIKLIQEALIRNEKRAVEVKEQLKLLNIGE